MAGASDNGGWPPEGGSPDGLPEFPEEWGVIVVPDDLSELSDEVDAIRAELHLTPPPNGWQRFARRPAVRGMRKVATLLLRAPVLIISMAILVTVASLFASAWPGPVDQPTTQRTSGTTAATTDQLPALELVATDGRPLQLRDRLPVVVLITDGCDCDALIADTVAAVRSDISVVVVSMTVPSVAASVQQPLTQTPQADGKSLRYAQDRTGELRRNLGLTDQDGTAAVLVVNRLGEIVRKVLRTKSVEEFRPDLARV
ncbi:hypothetical protein [Actinoplanes sp. NPDC051851]|uniref:hypothetical protein n=1 Tax=Actinoplanes sp. NPDC051851 TaxID=3154753 RepID=UPI00343B1504